MNNIESKLAKLEKQVKKYRIINFTLLGGMALFVLLSFNKKEILEDLRVRSLSVVDDFGNVYVNLSKRTEGGYVGVKNANGSFVVNMGVNKNGHGYSQVGNAMGKLKQETGVGTAGGGYSTVYNASGTLTASVYNDDNGNGYVSTYSNSGTELISIGCSNYGDGGLWIQNRSGYRSAYLGGDKGTLTLNNFYGKNRVWLLANEWGNGAVNLYNTDGNRVIYLGGGDHDKKGYLYTLDGYSTTGIFPR